MHDTEDGEINVGGYVTKKVDILCTIDRSSHLLTRSIERENHADQQKGCLDAYGQWIEALCIQVRKISRNMVVQSPNSF